MTDHAQPTPEEARRSRRVLLGFLAFFAVAAIGTTIFGFQVVARVKAAAKESDAALRTVAWNLLAVADAGAAFPSSPDDLVVEVDQLSGALAGASADWPGTRTEALADHPEMPLDAALVIVEVAWPPTPDLPPVLSVGGRPSGLVEDGPTIDHVNRWLRAAGAHLSSRAESSR